MMGKRKTILWISLLLLSTITGVFSIENVEADDVSVTLTDDAYVSTSYSNGTSKNLEISNGTFSLKISYIKFGLSNIHQQSTIDSATLKIHASAVAGSLDEVNLTTVDNSWDENDINWGNKPEDLANLGVIAINSEGWYEIVVTSSVQNALLDGEISFGLVPTNQNGVIFITAKENVTEMPQLIISYEPPDFPPTAGFTYVKDGLKVDFTDTSTDQYGTIVSWSWDFDNDGIEDSTLQDPQYIYPDGGEYTVVLNVTDDDGDTDETSQTLMTQNNQPTANFSYLPDVAIIDEQVQFTDSSVDTDGTIVSWSWDFDDDGIEDSTLQDPVYTYDEINTYTVSLITTDDHGATDTIEKQIITKTVNTTTLPAGIKTTVDLQTEAGIIVTINVTSSTTIDISQYSSNPTGEDISDSIKAVGNYLDVSVDDWGAVNLPINIKIYYTQQILDDAGISESNLEGIYFWNETSDAWELYNVTDVNTDDDYCWADAYHLTPLVLGGQSNRKPTAHMDPINPNPVTDGKPVSFSGYGVDTDGTITEYNWRSNLDGQLSTQASFSTSSLLIGTHTIYFKVKDNCDEWSDEVSDTLTVEPASGDDDDDDDDDTTGDDDDDNNIAPTADAGGPYYEIAGVKIIFNGYSSTDEDGTITSYDWDFGDGNKGSSVSPTHAYTKKGDYTITLTVTDNGGKTDVDTANAIITGGANNPPDEPTITGNETGTIDTNYTYTAQAEDSDGDTVCYVFEWGDNSGNTTTEYVVSNTTVDVVHKWVQPGVYAVSVYTKDVNEAVSATVKMQVQIDVEIETIDAEIDGYLIDYNQDGVYTTFYNDETAEETNVEKQEDGTYLIDSDGDDTWDYSYDPVTKTLIIYEPAAVGTEPGEETDSNEADYTIIYIAIAGIVVIVAIGFLCYKNQGLVIKILKQILETLKQIPKKLGIKQTMGKGMKKRRQKGKK